MNTKTIAVLVWTGSAVQGIAYTPQPKHKPAPAVVAEYLNGHRRYNPMTFNNDWKKSEERKAILQQIHSTCSEIRNQVEVYQIDRNTRISGVTAQQKTVIHATKLMADIANKMS